jgi:hypothetical protein
LGAPSRFNPRFSELRWEKKSAPSSRQLTEASPEKLKRQYSNARDGQHPCGRFGFVAGNLKQRIAHLEKKIQTKDEVTAELMAEHVALRMLGEL